MTQVVTPVPADPKERETRNWYLAQRIRQLMTQVSTLRTEVDPAANRTASEYLDVAWHDLRKSYNELVDEVYWIKYDGPKHAAVSFPDRPAARNRKRV
jgi:hypothetical protein